MQVVRGLHSRTARGDMSSEDELRLLFHEWREGDRKLIFLIEDPESENGWKLLDPIAIRAVADLISARVPDEDVYSTPLGLSIEQASKELGVSENTFRSLLKREENPVPSIMVGRRRIVPYHPLRDWMRDEAKRQGENRD